MTGCRSRERGSVHHISFLSIRIIDRFKEKRLPGLPGTALIGTNEILLSLSPFFLTSENKLYMVCDFSEFISRFNEYKVIGA